ncbi:MAG: hypothetical protein ACYC8T_30850, partial [Myxococcaceae bacterium]
VHLHVEAVRLGPEGSAAATLWLQAAFEGPVRGKLHVSGTDESGETAIDERFDLPPMEGGKVVRWTLPLRLRAAAAELLFRVDAPVPEKAERVRQPWKLFETIEVPKESTYKTYNDSPDSGSLLGSAAILGAGLMVGQLHLSLKLAGSLGQAGPGEKPIFARHAAHELPPGFVAAVVPAPGVLPAAGVEVVWAPGRELPAEARPGALAAATAPRQATSGLRECPECFRDVDAREAERSRECPRCGAAWRY